jgi:hypothetical protein
LRAHRETENFRLGLAKLVTNLSNRKLILSKAETHYRAQPDALAPMVDWLSHYGASPHAE